MTDEKREEVLEKLEAAVKASDADYEDLGIVNKKEFQETQDENQTLHDENESLKEENEDLQEEIDEVKSLYAESLGEVTGLDADFFMDKDLQELKELHSEKVDEDLIETPEPDIKSGDVPDEEEQKKTSDAEEEVFAELNEHFENPALGKYPRTSAIESTEDLKQIISTFEGRGGVWEAAAEPYREALEKLSA